MLQRRTRITTEKYRRLRLVVDKVCRKKRLLKADARSMGESGSGNIKEFYQKTKEERKGFKPLQNSLL